MRLEAKRFIPFEFPGDNPQLDQHGFTLDESQQHAEYPDHCNIPTVIHVNPQTHAVAIAVVVVNDKTELQVTLVPVGMDL